MGRPDHAVDLFREGRACSQAVLLAWADDLALEAAPALRLAAPFAAGMRLGATCGAVTGALMVIGLLVCADDCTTREGRLVTVGPTEEFVTRFTERCGSLQCPAILGLDLREPDGWRRAAAEGLFATHCAPAVRAAAEILEELFGSRVKEEAEGEQRVLLGEGPPAS